MINKLLVYMILGSMTLHCASRVGVLDHAYQKRHELAYSIGIISEIPIAMCSSDYDFGQEMMIQTNDDSHAIPQSVASAKEINLFFNSEYDFPRAEKILLISSPFINTVDLYYLKLEVSIFHPPSLEG